MTSTDNPTARGIGLRIHSIASLPFRDRGDGMSSGVIYDRLQRLIGGDWAAVHVLRRGSAAAAPATVTRMNIDAGAQVDIEAITVPDAPERIFYRVTVPLTLYLAPEEAAFLVDGVYATPPTAAPEQEQPQAHVELANQHPTADPAPSEATEFERIAKLNADEDTYFEESIWTEEPLAGENEASS